MPRTSRMGPDNYWFGVGPQILPDRRGPNRNTFLTHIARQVPDLAIQLPSNAVGKDFLPGGRVVALAPSGSGFQVLPYGLIGILFAAGEGLELNLLRLSLGVDPGQAGTVAAGPRQARDGGPINGSRRSL